MLVASKSGGATTAVHGSGLTQSARRWVPLQVPERAAGTGRGRIWCCCPRRGPGSAGPRQPAEQGAHEQDGRHGQVLETEHYGGRLFHFSMPTSQSARSEQPVKFASLEGRYRPTTEQSGGRS